MAKIRALFIGNSFTTRNDLPGLVSQLVAAGGKGELGCELISISGAPLRTHLNNGDAQERMRSQHYEYVVLQEQSTLPIKNAGRSLENICDFDTHIRAAGARTVLYMTWARRSAPQDQDALSTAYIQAGSVTGAIVVSAGLAWQRCLQDHPEILLHDKDGSHPNLAGSYLAACAFYAALFLGRSRSIPAIDIDLQEHEIDALHTAALETVRAHKKS